MRAFAPHSTPGSWPLMPMLPALIDAPSKPRTGPCGAAVLFEPADVLLLELPHATATRLVTSNAAANVRNRPRLSDRTNMSPPDDGRPGALGAERNGRGDGAPVLH